METTRATAVLVSAEDAAHCPVAALIDPNPYLAYARIAALMHPQLRRGAGHAPERGRGQAARVSRPLPALAALAVIEDDAEIGERVVVGPGCIVQRGARVGADTELVSRVNLYPGVTLGERCILHAGAVIGADGFGFAPECGDLGKSAASGQRANRR